MTLRVHLSTVQHRLALSVSLAWACVFLIVFAIPSCGSDQESLGLDKNCTTQPSPEKVPQVAPWDPAVRVALWPFRHRGDSRLGVKDSYGFLDRKGKVCIAPQFTGAHRFSEGLAGVSLGLGKRRQWGFIDKRAVFVIQAEYKQVGSFSQGLARVAVDDSTAIAAQTQPRDSLHGLYRWGFIDRTGKTVIKAQFTYAWYFSEGLAAVSTGRGKKQRWGFIDRKGQFAIRPRFSKAVCFQEGLAFVRVGGLYGYINKSGDMIIKPQYEFAWSFNYGVAGVRKGGEFCLINRAGKLIISSQTMRRGNSPLKKMMVRSPREGLAWIGLHEGVGFVDLSGKVVIKPQFHEASDFSEGLARVRVKDDDLQRYYGYIDRTGKIVIKPQFLIASNFYGGVAHVRMPDSRGKKGEWFLIDGNGAFLEKLPKGNIPLKIPSDLTR